MTQVQIMKQWNRGRKRLEFARFALAGFILLVGCQLAGCGDGEGPKTSHFEDDHHVAAHWPSGLADLSDKLRKRLAEVNDGVKSNPQAVDRPAAPPQESQLKRLPIAGREAMMAEVSTQDQILDLVGWVGEVAADTDLPEADWVPLYDSSQALAARLRGAQGELSTDHIEAIRSLCVLIDQSVEKIIALQPETVVEQS